MIEIIVIGNIGSLRLVEAKETAVLNLSVASSRRFGDREFVDWVSARVWGERASKLAPHLTKGCKLMLRGRPEARGYQRQDGTMAGELVLHVHEIEFLSPKARNVRDAGGDELPLSEEKKPKRKGKP